MENRTPKVSAIRKKKETAVNDIVNELRLHTGKGTIRASELAGFLGDKNVSRVKSKYLRGLEAIGGRAYLIPEVAERLKENCIIK